MSKVMQKIAEEVRPSLFLDYKNWLLTLYLKANEELGTYSYASFAEDLGFNANNILHHIVKGRRPLTIKASEKITKALKLTSTEKKYLLELINYNNAKSQIQQNKAFENLTKLKARSLGSSENKQWLEFYSKWYHSAITELCRLEGFQSDSKWIADKLFNLIRPEQAKASLQLLEELKLIRYDATKNRHLRTRLNPSTPHQVKNVGVSNFHQGMISLAMQSINKFKKHERDITSITLAADEAFLKQLKKEIEAFQTKVEKLEKEIKNPTKILQLNTQLFPITKLVENK